MTVWGRWVALVAMLAASGCGDAAEPEQAGNNGENNGGNNVVVDVGAAVDRQVGEPEVWSCGTVTRHAATSYRHVPEDANLRYNANPPCIGSHFGTWLAWGEYESALDPGFYVHNLEHGGIAYLYDCPDGCEADVATIREYIATVPRDDGGAFRYTLGPVAGLPARFSMVAWGVAWTGDSLCTEDLDRFRTENYRMAPEDVAVPGHRPDEQPGD